MGAPGRACKTLLGLVLSAGLALSLGGAPAVAGTPAATSAAQMAKRAGGTGPSGSARAALRRDEALAEALSAQVQQQGVALAKLAEQADQEAVTSARLAGEARRARVMSQGAGSSLQAAKAELISQALTAYTDGASAPGGLSAASTASLVEPTYAQTVIDRQHAALVEYQQALHNDRVDLATLHQRLTQLAAAWAQLASARQAAAAEQAALARSLSQVKGRVALDFQRIQAQQAAAQQAEEQAMLASSHQLPPGVTDVASRSGLATAAQHVRLAASAKGGPTTTGTTTTTGPTTTGTTSTTSTSTTTAPVPVGTPSPETTQAPTTQAPTTQAPTTQAPTTTATVTSGTSPSTTAGPGVSAPASTTTSGQPVPSTPGTTTSTTATTSGPGTSATTTSGTGSGTGPGGSVPGAPSATGVPGTTTTVVAGPVPNTAAAGSQVALTFARAQLGKPYEWGGAGPQSYDCSGLVMMAWGKAGVSLPHSAQFQYDMTERVPIADLLPGDLIFFGTPKDVYPVGI